MENKGLYEKLIEYSSRGAYPFHMPGHKRQRKLMEGKDPFDVDITEISDFDNLHHATGIIKEAMDNASEYFGTDRTWFLINGSSCGILGALHAVLNIGDSVVIGRNCHKAVYHAAEIRNLQVEYLYPEYISDIGINGGYNPDELIDILSRNRKIKAVVITSPTYDGIVSDVKKIAEITHRYGAVLIVDEAHGAHFGLSDRLPAPAYQLGADLVIESVHKTLPSLTQTALLHLRGERVDSGRIEESLGIYQSSSPSYLFMASIDKCIRDLQINGRQEMEVLLKSIEQFREEAGNLRNIYIPGKELIGKDSVFDLDITKLMVFAGNRKGRWLAKVLRDKYNYEMEMETPSYVLAITTIADDINVIKEFGNRLGEIDKILGEDNDQISYDNFSLLRNETKCSIYEAKKHTKASVKIEDAKGMISGEYLYLYPPGIPLLVPGEIISYELLEQVKLLKQMNMNINGLVDKTNCFIEVLDKKIS